jgi:oligopeptide/dipeptide ABC transporter ATP-binding protein
MAETTHNGNLLTVTDLRTYFETDDGTVKAVDGISFAVRPGETLGIVGESGSGKSVANLSLMRLISEPPGKIVSGSVNFHGRDVLKMSAREVRDLRGKRMAMIFQDPMTSLNPFMRVSKQLMEVTQLHLGHSKAEARAHAIKMLDHVGIPDAPERVDGYPHEFSGGMRQRVMIAMALSCEPELLIADEPTTALDVTIQAQILDLLVDLKQRLGMSLLLITHNLGIVNTVADRVAVMYAGQVVETGSARELISTPRHPYTRALIRALPRIGHEQERLEAIPGTVPSPGKFPAGCRFHPRCSVVQTDCRSHTPTLQTLEAGRQVRCPHWQKP